MNRRIHPGDLLNSPYKELIDELALRWGHAELSAQELTYADCLTDIKTLLLTTQSLERTTRILETVLTQAVALHKTSAWVEQELKFEGMLEGADRVDFLRFELEQADRLDDALLDQYNERVNRFS